MARLAVRDSANVNSSSPASPQIALPASLENVQMLERRAASLESHLASQRSRTAELIRGIRNSTVRIWYLRAAEAARKAIDRTILWRPGAALIFAALFGGPGFFLPGGLFSAAVLTLGGFLAAGLLLFWPDDGRLSSRIESLQLRLAQLSTELENASTSTNEGEAHLRQCQLEAVRMQRELNDQSRNASRKCRLEGLLAQSWKALRSEPFEQFLEAVFRELGYTTELTKVTGDQGVDLIVSLRGKRIAIQVKGYFHSVSNGAVQEAHAGKAFYNCDACAVITNSRFTASALELAKVIGCIMVDEDLLPKLILGEIDLWQMCFGTA